MTCRPGLTLSTRFNFGSDFDWIIDLGAGGGYYTYPIDLSADLSHTLMVQYQGPTGTSFASASGLFPGSSAAPAAVPEPSGAALILPALLGLAAARLRRRRTGG